MEALARGLQYSSSSIVVARHSPYVAVMIAWSYRGDMLALGCRQRMQLYFLPVPRYPGIQFGDSRFVCSVPAWAKQKAVNYSK